MPRLIDANKLRKDVLDMPNCYNGFSDTYDKALIIDLIDEQPTVDAEPVKHGRWLDVLVADDEGETDGVECSECGYTDINVYWAKTYHRFCPNCGAKMDGERREDAETN